VALSLLSALLWFVGGLVFVLGPMRAKAISSIAGWVVVLGAVTIPVLVIAFPKTRPQSSMCPWSCTASVGCSWVTRRGNRWRRLASQGKPADEGDLLPNASPGRGGPAD
jgi:hypothetical protein